MSSEQKDLTHGTPVTKQSSQHRAAGLSTQQDFHTQVTSPQSRFQPAPGEGHTFTSLRYYYDLQTLSDLIQTHMKREEEVKRVRTSWLVLMMIRTSSPCYPAERNSGVKRVCVCETEFGSLLYFCGDNDQLEGFPDDNHVK